MLAGYIKGGAAAIPFVATLLAVTIALRVVTKTATSRVKIEKTGSLPRCGDRGNRCGEFVRPVVRWSFLW